MKLIASSLSLVSVLLLAACQTTEPPQPTPRQKSQPATPQPSADYKPPKVLYNPEYDPQIREIFDLAKKNEWEEAQFKANQLTNQVPDDPAIQRLNEWVTKQRQYQRDKALEDKIREVDAKNSVFNPNIVDLLTEKKDRGLPPRKDVRDTISRLESSRYIPDTYGKTVHKQGPLFDLNSTNSRMAAVLEKDVSIHLDNVTLEAVILEIGKSAGINFVADKSIAALKQTLSLNLDKVNLRELLRHMSRNYNLQFQVGEDLVWIVDGKDPKKLYEETRFYRLRKGFVLPAKFGAEEVNRRKTTVKNVTTVTETTDFRQFVNDEAPDVPSIERAITNMFTGKYMIDYERNLIVARGTPEQLEILEKIIDEFDRPIQQVLIEARFITVSKPAFLQLGVLWETGRNLSTNEVRSPQDFTGLISSQDLLSRMGVGLQETFTNVLNRHNLTATISALEQSGESQTLSAPRLTVLNNLPATISDGRVQYYYEEFAVRTTATADRISASSFVPSGKPTKVTAGAELDVLASISGDGKSIVLALNPRVNTEVTLKKSYTLSLTGDEKQSFDILLPEYRSQSLATRVVVNSGDTVVMGGVLERNQTTLVESVPILGNLPLIGPLFRRRTEVDRPRYLLIFVTATIISDSGEFVIYGEDNGGRNRLEQ